MAHEKLLAAGTLLIGLSLGGCWADDVARQGGRTAQELAEGGRQNADELLPPPRAPAKDTLVAPPPAKDRISPYTPAIKTACETIAGVAFADKPATTGAAPPLEALLEAVAGHNIHLGVRQRFDDVEETLGKAREGQDVRADLLLLRQLYCPTATAGL